ncbi:MAG: hypothetical protein ACYC0X_33105 [Pirellulaceae bacterium]
MTSQDEIRPIRRITSVMRVAFRRMCAMAGAWSLLGVAMGLNCEQLVQGDRIGLVANIVAWIIVMSFTGALVSLLGGRPIDSFVGAGLGAIIITAISIELPAVVASRHMQVNFGALLGALVAVTLCPWIRMVIFVSVRVRSMLASAN